MNSKSLISLTLLFLFLIVITIPVEAQAIYPTYEIQPGDSLGFLAGLFGTTIEEIAQINNISNPDLISPGQSILIPRFPGLQGKLTITVTELGESYQYLPVKYQVDDNLIQKINSLLSPASIYAGSELILLIPDDSNSLTPVSYTTNSQTSLEISARLQSNPQTLLLENYLERTNEIIPGSLIFMQQNSQHSPLALFSPALGDVTLSPLPLEQGGTEVISIKTRQEAKLSGNIGNIDLNFYKTNPGEYYALQGIHALQQPGLVDFSITATFDDGSILTFSQPVLVESGNFDEDPPLNVDPSTIDPSVTGPENDLVLSLVSNQTSIKQWDSLFSSPAYYQEYNSLFGTRRQYNEDPTIYFHTGVDFAGGMTLPVTAPAAGRVVFAGPLTVRGNTVFIDHGWGVFSGFFHQDTLLISEGDLVSAGQQIGTVGNTGRVNGAGDYLGAGAHLHWELWVNGIQVNPLDWLINHYP